MADSTRYGAIAILLHWSIAFLILAAFVLGLTIDDFPKAWNVAVVNAHALIGLAVLVLSLVRLFWRLTHPAPQLPATIAPLAGAAAKVAHVGLYILMIAVPLIGVPTLLFRGRGLDFGLFGIGSPFAATREVFRPLTQVHQIAAYCLIGLAAGHALAALYHQYIRQDDILTRMAPRRSGA